MKNYVKLISPAKVNLVLAVGRKREDGFHCVNTIMHSLALHDSLIMRRFEEDDEQGLKVILRCETSGDIEPLDVAPQDNIAYRAVEELAKELGRSENETIQLSLSKVIPAQAGLGGGSSNAAAALLGAAALWGIDPDDERLFAVASRLGADVAFFLKGGCTYLSGKGEIFESSLEPRRGFALLVRPSVGVSTAKAYAVFDESPTYPTQDYLDTLAQHTSGAEVELWNNLTDAACQVTPEVKEVMDWARTMPQSKEVLLCGSGSAVCILCDSYQDAYNCSLDAFKRGWWNRITSFSPVGVAIVESY